MAAADKRKLDGMEAGADRTTTTTSLMATVQGVPLDGTVGPVLVEMIDSQKNYFANSIAEINSNLPISSWPGCKLHYTRWTGTVVAGQVTLLGSALAPEGHDIVALFFSPLSNVHIAMFRQGDNVYAWSENYTGEFVYDVLMLIYPANAQAQKQ